MSDLPTKHSNYSTFQLSGGENDTIFTYDSDRQNQNQGPTKYNTEGEGAADYANRSAMRKENMKEKGKLR